MCMFNYAYIVSYYIYTCKLMPNSSLHTYNEPHNRDQLKNLTTLIECMWNMILKAL